MLCSRRAFKIALSIAVCWTTAAWESICGQVPATPPTVGLHSANPEWYVLRGGTVHLDAHRQLDNAAVVIHGQKIVAVGTDAQAPEGAEVIDVAGKHLYPGFIDSYLPWDTAAVSRPATAYWNQQIRPEVRVADGLDLSKLGRDDLRKSGFTAALLAPTEGIVRGSSCLVHISDGPAHQALLRGDVAQHAQLTARFRFGGRDTGDGPSYPTSPMGAYALARQALYDAIWYRDAWRAAQNDPRLPRPERNETLEALQAALAGDLPFATQISNELFALRADRFAREFGLRLVLLGSGNEYRRLSEVAALGAPVILPVDFPKPPDVKSPAAALNVTLEALMHWDHAPENPARLVGASVPIAFTTDGLEKPTEFWKQLRLAVERGLSETAALEALTTAPARLFGVDGQLGTLEPGKFASLVVSDLPLFDAKSKIVETWVAGARHEYDAAAAIRLDGLWEIQSPEQSDLHSFLALRSKAKPSASIALNRDDADGEKAIELKDVTVQDAHFSASFDFEKFGAKGTALIQWVVDRPDSALGSVVLPDGTVRKLQAARVGDLAEKPKRGGKRGRGDDEPSAEESAESEEKSTKEESPTDASPDKPADDEEKGAGGADEKPRSEPAGHPVQHPLGDFGRSDLPPQPATVLIKNVTLWTCGPQGVLERGSVLFGNGKILQIFPEGAELPAAELEVDGSGKHLTPGIIDCHSHMATDSGVNEVGQAITAEVRIGDFIDCNDITIYRQLAGGVTAANILHGSANPIGGQNQVIKLRWGANDQQMKFAEAPAGIKFALGENVKQSNRQSPSSRYPQTRMGVEQIMHDAFRAAGEYRDTQKRWEETHRGLPPRRDLELEALAEILEGQRWIHCHSYRQDEILALIRVLDQYDITIGSFQHILEGYKVADAMAKHGATASAFSDWWAYKMEVFDAIPYAGAIMHNAGIVVSFNSDDGELARHLNHEAAKAVRYGGLSPEEALKFVTLNPAKQLRIDAYVGSIEPGKHADLVLWSGDPLAVTSVCEQTWIDGRRYFDRALEATVAQQHAAMKAELIQKVLRSGQDSAEPERGRFDPARLWPRYDEYCGHSHHHDDELHAHEHHHDEGHSDE